MSDTVGLPATIAKLRVSWRKGARLRMDALNSPGLRGLIERLPFPLVLFDSQSGVGFANHRFADIFVSGQLKDPDLQRLTQSPGGAWQAVTLRRCDGRDLVTYAQAVIVADGVLLVFDEAGSPAWTQEIERLRQRITELESLRATDPLPGAWNRVQLERLIDVEIQQCYAFRSAAYAGLARYRSLQTGQRRLWASHR